MGFPVAELRCLREAQVGLDSEVTDTLPDVVDTYWVRGESGEDRTPEPRTVDYSHREGSVMSGSSRSRVVPGKDTMGVSLPNPLNDPSPTSVYSSILSSPMVLLAGGRRYGR